MQDAGDAGCLPPFACILHPASCILIAVHPILFLLSHPRSIALALAALGVFLPFAARGGNTITYTVPVIPPGANAAVIPAPRNDWVARAVTNDMLAAKRQPAVRLIFDGDSITDHWQTVGKAEWDKHFAGLQAFDFAIGGDRTEHLLWRLAHGQLDTLKPRLVVLMIGTNNLYRDKDEQIAEGVEAIVREYQRHCPGAVILLQGILPRGEKPSDPFRARIQHINSLLARLADGKRVLYLDFGDKLLEPDGTLSRDMMPDFLHPSAAAYAIWAAEIAPVIGKVLGSA
jgi:hypothetical protein